MPSTGSIEDKELYVDGITHDMVWELCDSQLLRSELRFRNQDQNHPYYLFRLSAHGAERIRLYRDQQRAEAHQNRIEITQQTANFYVKCTFWIALAGLCVSAIALMCSWRFF